MDRLWLVSAHGYQGDRFARVPPGVHLHFTVCGSKSATDMGSDSYLTREGFTSELKRGRFVTYSPGDAYPDLHLGFHDENGLIMGLFDVDTLRQRERVMTRRRPIMKSFKFRATSMAAASQFTKARKFKIGRSDSWTWVQQHQECFLSEVVHALWRGHFIVNTCRTTDPDHSYTATALDSSPHRRVYPGKRKFVSAVNVLLANPTLMRVAKQEEIMASLQLKHLRQENENLTRLVKRSILASRPNLDAGSQVIKTDGVFAAQAPSADWSKGPKEALSAYE